MPEEKRREINTTALAVGGAVIAICGLGAYYIYSRNELLRRFMEAVEDYKQEYYEFAESDGISEQEQQLLDVKRQKINTLMHEIEAKGLVEQAIDLLWAASIFLIVWYVGGIIAEIIKRYFKRHPRDPDTGDPPPEPSKPYKDITDATWHPTPEDLVDHYHDVHPIPGTDPDAWEDVWKDIRGFPQWVIDLLSAFSLDGLDEWVKHDYRELDPTVQRTILFLIGAAIVIVCLLVGWYAPGILEKGRGILIKLDAIPT